MNHIFNLNLEIAGKIKKMLPDLIRLVQYEPEGVPYKAVPINKNVCI